MTLKEKFTINQSINTKGEADRFSKECIKIADEYLIDAIEWISKNEFNIDYYVRLGKTNEIVNQYKKEKEL